MLAGAALSIVAEVVGVVDVKTRNAVLTRLSSLHCNCLVSETTVSTQLLNSPGAPSAPAPPLNYADHV